MTIAFDKYQGAGNDFIIIDNRKDVVDPADFHLINRLCDRRFGIGADGLILVSCHDRADYEMKYFNADGKLGSMCGNGGRCTAHFALRSGIAGAKQRFLAFDGLHEAIVARDTVRLQIGDVYEHRKIGGNYFIDTGSPHYVVFADDLDNLNVVEEGRKLRWSPLFAPGGTNVNFVRIDDKGISIRTFERGVEDETLACGTGATASVIASILAGRFDRAPVSVRARGGALSVDFKIQKDKITDIWLTGPVSFVFEGKIGV